jgi:hypothetical protein
MKAERNERFWRIADDYLERPGGLLMAGAQR